STLTRNLARLEDGGLVAKDGDVDDARAYRVGLTASGRRAANRLERQEEAFAAEILARLPEAERPRVLEALSHLPPAGREATEGCCPDAFTHLMDGFPARRARREGGDDGRRSCGGTCWSQGGGEGPGGRSRAAIALSRGPGRSESGASAGTRGWGGPRS